MHYTSQDNFYVLAQIKEPLAHAKFGCKGNIILKMRLS